MLRVQLESVDMEVEYSCFCRRDGRLDYHERITLRTETSFMHWMFSKMVRRAGSVGCYNVHNRIEAEYSVHTFVI